ncbi:tetratricopeptide repeat protein [Cellulomonas sp. SG140]|uniref:tetratricopeptide repeat protein n=1 Tax=Cellulomonas sp. SG140 TaxID=2976536 RepID=UPI0021E76368|nr:tetratricopeptide repeat protein [Cellulomonas sp. SG140]
MSTPQDRPPARRRYTGLVGAVLVTALLAVWVWLVGVRSVQLIATGRAVGIALGAAFLVLPLLVIALIVREWLLAVDVQRMADELDRAGELPVDDLPRSPGGRVDRQVARERFEPARQAVEATPEDWRAWYRLAFAYDAAGDRRRARGSLRSASRLHRRRVRS